MALPIVDCRSKLLNLSTVRFIALISLLVPNMVHSETIQLAVSPDRIDDVPILRVDKDSFPRVDEFAWRAFIALNWPALIEPSNRGKPDRTKSLGDAGPRVWETFKTRYELYPVGDDGQPVKPSPWSTYDSPNPCSAKHEGYSKTLASFEPFADFNQTVAPGIGINTLVAQNRTYTRYEVHVNQIQFSELAQFSDAPDADLPNSSNPVQMPAGSIAIKAAWRILTDVDTPGIRARFYVVENANVVDIDKTIKAQRVVCSPKDIALVGMHIVIRTPHRPQGIWSSFEHIDNVPPIGTGIAREPDAQDLGMPYSYFNPSHRQTGIWPPQGEPKIRPVSLEYPPNLNPQPMQVVRQYPIHPSTMEMNRSYWKQPGIKNTVWENYMLVANQWPTFTRIVDPANDGIYYPDKRGENLVNTTMETYMQASPSSCMSCHRDFNAKGFDFVGMFGSFR